MLAIPSKRTDRTLFEYLEKREIESLLAAIDIATWTAIRDHIMLMALYNARGRVSEIAELKIKNVGLKRQHTAHLCGKGRKERVLPLWPETIVELKKWSVSLPNLLDNALFSDWDSGHISRFGVAQRLKCAVNGGKETYPLLKGRKITPHSTRHITPVHSIQSGIDLTVYLHRHENKCTANYLKKVS